MKNSPFGLEYVRNMRKNLNFSDSKEFSHTTKKCLPLSHVFIHDIVERSLQVDKERKILLSPAFFLNACTSQSFLLLLSIFIVNPISHPASRFCMATNSNPANKHFCTAINCWSIFKTILSGIFCEEKLNELLVL